jgi:hypothetical protein
MFAGKLDFIMKLTDTSNSALGRDLGFDPSYISRMRSGKRGLPRDRFFLEPAAAYFARRLQERPLGKSAAAEAVCPGRDWPESENEAEKLLLSWLGQDERQDMERVDRLLNGLAAARLLWPEAKMPPQREAPSGAAFYYGTEGKREAVLRLLNDYRAADAPTELLVYSDEKSDWLADESYARSWMEAALRLIERGVRIRIIHPLAWGWRELMDGLRKWLPLYLTGEVETWYYPKPRDGVFHRTLFVAVGHSALASSSVGEGDGLNLLVSDPAAVAALAREFQDYLSLCAPLIRVYKPENRRDVWKMLAEFEAAPHSRIVAQRLPLGCTLPEETIASFGLRAGQELVHFLRDAVKHLEQHLAAGLTVTELLSLPPAEEVRNGLVSQPMSEYMGFDLRYTPEELKAHLGQVTALLRRRDGYRVVLTDRIPEGAMLYAKEDLGCFLVRIAAPTTVFYCTEKRLTAAFWSYLQHNANLGQSRELVIRYLEEYMEKL